MSILGRAFKFLTNGWEYIVVQFVSPITAYWGILSLDIKPTITREKSSVKLEWFISHPLLSGTDPILIWGSPDVAKNGEVLLETLTDTRRLI
jgi:hypothetical protein